MEENEKLQYCMDYEYWIRLGLCGVTPAHVPTLLAGSRLYAETKTLGARLKVHKEINNMLKKVLGKVPDRWIRNYSHVYVEEKVIYQKTMKFKIILAIVYVYSTIRWNKMVPIITWNRLCSFLRTLNFS